MTLPRHRWDPCSCASTSKLLLITAAVALSVMIRYAQVRQASWDPHQLAMQVGQPQLTEEVQGGRAISRERPDAVVVDQQQKAPAIAGAWPDHSGRGSVGSADQDLDEGLGSIRSADGGSLKGNRGGLSGSQVQREVVSIALVHHCLLYTSPSPRDATLSRMPSSA